MVTQTNDDPAVLWLRAPQLCHLGGYAPESGEIIVTVQKLKDDMSADLADSQKADEEDRKSDFYLRWCDLGRSRRETPHPSWRVMGEVAPAWHALEL